MYETLSYSLNWIFIKASYDLEQYELGYNSKSIFNSIK